MGRGGNRLSLGADGLPGPSFLSLQEGPQPPLAWATAADTLEPGCCLLTLPGPSSCVVLMWGWGVARRRNPCVQLKASAGRVDTVKLGTLSRKYRPAMSGPPGLGSQDHFILVPEEQLSLLLCPSALPLVGAPAIRWPQRPPAHLLHHPSTQSPPSTACSQLPSACAATLLITSLTGICSSQGVPPSGHSPLPEAPSPHTPLPSLPLQEPPSGWTNPPFPSAAIASHPVPSDPQCGSQLELHTAEPVCGLWPLS